MNNKDSNPDTDFNLSCLERRKKKLEWNQVSKTDSFFCRKEINKRMRDLFKCWQKKNWGNERNLDNFFTYQCFKKYIHSYMDKLSLSLHKNYMSFSTSILSSSCKGSLLLLLFLCKVWDRKEENKVVLEYKQKAENRSSQKLDCNTIVFMIVACCF